MIVWPQIIEIFGQQCRDGHVGTPQPGIHGEKKIDLAKRSWWLPVSISHTSHGETIQTYQPST